MRTFHFQPLSAAARAATTHPTSAGVIVLSVGAGLMGCGLILAISGVGHRFDYRPGLKRPFAIVGLSIFGVGLILLIIGLLTK